MNYKESKIRKIEFISFILVFIAINGIGYVSGNFNMPLTISFFLIGLFLYYIHMKRGLSRYILTGFWVIYWLMIGIIKNGDRYKISDILIPILVIILIYLIIKKGIFWYKNFMDEKF